VAGRCQCRCRGGAVTGTNHLDVLVPVLLQAFGQRWFEQGSMINL